MNPGEFERYSSIVREQAKIESKLLLLKAEQLLIEKKETYLTTCTGGEMTAEEAIEFLGLDISPRTLRSWHSVEQQKFPPPDPVTKKFAVNRLIGWRDAPDKEDYCEQFFDE